MWGNAYGSVNGETNRLISFIKAERVGWGEYRIDVDMTPLGATSYTYQVWSHGVLTMHATNQGPCSGISTYDLEDHNPRVNPFFMGDAGTGAIIEFPNKTRFFVRNSVFSGVGDRIMIIAEGATNQVNYASRVDVFGSANLHAFLVTDTRIGMFDRPHKAMGDVNFSARNGRLTVGPFDGLGTDGPIDGVLVDFKTRALRWTAQTEPFVLEASNAALLLSGSGRGSIDPYYDSFWGPAGFVRSNGVLYLFADFSELGTSNCVLQVFRSNVLSGAIYGVNGTALASLTATNPLVAGWTANTSSLSLLIAEPATVTGHEGTVLEGDRFEFAPHQATVQIGYIKSVHVRAHGTPGFTIVSELTEETPVPEMRVEIERAGPQLVVSWPDHRYFFPVVQTNVIGGYVVRYPAPRYRDFRWEMRLSPTNAMQFFSLYHQNHYYVTP